MRQHKGFSKTHDTQIDCNTATSRSQHAKHTDCTGMQQHTDYGTHNTQLVQQQISTHNLPLTPPPSKPPPSPPPSPCPSLSPLLTSLPFPLSLLPSPHQLPPRSLSPLVPDVVHTQVIDVEHGLVSAVKGEQHSFHCTGITQDGNLSRMFAFWKASICLEM